MQKFCGGKGILLLIFLLFSNNLHSEITQKTYVEVGEGNSSSGALKNALHNVLMKCAEEIGGTPVDAEKLRKLFPFPGDYFLGYKIISSKYEDKKVILEVKADVDIRYLRDIFIKEGIIGKKWTLPKVSMVIKSQNECKNLNMNELHNFLTGISKSEFSDYFRETPEPEDYQMKIELKGEKREMEEISWCLISVGLEIRSESEEIFNETNEKPVYMFSSDTFPVEISDFVKRFFLRGIQAIEKNREEKGNIVKIIIRTAGWLQLKDIDSIKKLLFQNFPTLFSFNLISINSQGVECECRFIGAEGGIMEKIISVFSANGWNARKITEELIEVKKE